jgi:predicted RNase H-like HicB family nuclease
MKFLVVIEKSRTGYAAYSPDLDGCVAAGRTRKATEKAMRAALAMHLSALQEDGGKLPVPRSYSTYVELRRTGRRPRRGGAGRSLVRRLR